MGKEANSNVWSESRIAFYILLPSNVLSPEIDEVCCELVTCRHSKSPSWAVDTRWVHLNSLQSPMMSNVTVTITVTEAVFSHLLRKESSDTRASHAHKQTQGAPFCTCNTRQYIRTSGWSVNSADRGHKSETGVTGLAGVIVRRGHSHGSNVQQCKTHFENSTKSSIFTSFTCLQWFSSQFLPEVFEYFATVYNRLSNASDLIIWCRTLCIPMHPWVISASNEFVVLNAVVHFWCMNRPSKWASKFGTSKFYAFICFQTSSPCTTQSNGNFGDFWGIIWRQRQTEVTLIVTWHQWPGTVDQSAKATDYTLLYAQVRLFRVETVPGKDGLGDDGCTGCAASKKRNPYRNIDFRSVYQAHYEDFLSLKSIKLDSRKSRKTFCRNDHFLPWTAGDQTPP